MFHSLTNHPRIVAGLVIALLMMIGVIIGLALILP